MLDARQNPELDELMNRVKRDRCEASFRQLFDHFYAKALFYFEQGGVGGQKSSDLAQDTLLTVWHKASYFDSSKGSCRTWIFTIARNLRYDYFRSQSKELLSIPADDLFEVFEDPAFQIDTKNRSDDIRKQVSTLPTEQREAVQAMYFEGYSHGEYAQLKKIPLGTVKSRIRLALAQIKKGLEAL